MKRIINYFKNRKKEKEKQKHWEFMVKYFPKSVLVHCPHCGKPIH